MHDPVEKTESPTPRRREELRGEGRTARSGDLTAAAVLLAGVLAMAPIGTFVVDRAAQIVSESLAGQGGATGSLLLAGVGMVAPLAAAALLAGLLTGWAQSGFLIALQPLTPRWSRLSPGAGLEQVCSGAALARLGMGLAKLTVVMLLAGTAAAAELPAMMGLVSLEGGALMSAVAWMVWRVAAKVAAALIVLGLLDYALQRRRLERELSLTPREAREERKRTEGDPIWKSQRARVARRIVQRRSAGDVGDAEALLVHPRGYAVAIRYDAVRNAPRVVARGAGAGGRLLRDSCAARGIPVFDHGPLARSLFFGADVGRVPSTRDFEALARVLAQAYQITGRKPR